MVASVYAFSSFFFFLLSVARFMFNDLIQNRTFNPTRWSFHFKIAAAIINIARFMFICFGYNECAVKHARCSITSFSRNVATGTFFSVSVVVPHSKCIKHYTIDFGRYVVDCLMKEWQHFDFRLAFVCSFNLPCHSLGHADPICQWAHCKTPQ